MPVTAKLRLGWDNPEAIHVNAERAAEGGAAWLTIHARTKSQGYRLPAYWTPIGAVRSRLAIPVVANSRDLDGR
jgi:tRNA-dihydrouridine synthase C